MESFLNKGVACCCFVKPSNVGGLYFLVNNVPSNSGWGVGTL
jgi:hypothetical protein